MVVNLTTKEFQHNPYPIYENLRKDSRVAAVKLGLLGDAVMVTRYEDVVTVLKDPRFSNERYKALGTNDWLTMWWIPGPLRVLAKSMVLIDDPDHARLRNLVHKGFTPRRIQQLETRIEAICHTLLDEATTKPSVDLMRDFAQPLPLTVISEMMGVPREDQRKFHKLMSDLVRHSAPSDLNISNVLGLIFNGIALNRFFRNLIALKRKQPQDDLITILIQAEEQGDRLSEDELIAMLFLLLLAGHETTVNLIGSGTLALLEHPEQMENLLGDMSLLDSAIEEMLRFTNPVHHVAQRYAMEDVPLMGYTVTKGSTVAVGIASANRDEAIFENADQFDITRSNNRHVAFGLGIHYCLGAPLARLEAKIAFTALLTRFPHLKLAAPVESLEWRGAPALRGLKHLPIYLHR